MDIGKWLCKLGIHDWERPESDVTRGTSYTEVCSRCRKLR